MGYVSLHDLPDQRGGRRSAFEKDIPRIVSLGYDALPILRRPSRPENRCLFQPFLPPHRALWHPDQLSKESGPSVEADVLRSYRAPFSRTSARQYSRPRSIRSFDLAQLLARLTGGATSLANEAS